MTNQPGKAQRINLIGSEDISSGDESLQPGASQKQYIENLGDNLENVTKIDFNTNPGALDFVVGRMFYDAVDRTISVMVNTDSEPVTLQIGQEQYIIIRNNTGAQIDNGSALFITGSIAYRPTVALAKADSLLTTAVFGVATQDIPNNTEGIMTTFGMVRDFDTQTPGWAEGDVLYLSEITAGLLINTFPTSGFNLPVAMVIRRHPTDGAIFVRPWTTPAIGALAAGNYTQFSFDGTMRAVGNAVCYKDELQSLVSSAALVTPANDIVKNPAEGTVTFKTTARYPTDYVVTNHQLNHDWMPGTIVDPHLHWWQLSANMPNWLIEYRWQKQLQDKTTAWTQLVIDQNKGTWVSNPFNQISETLNGITPPVGYGSVSDIIQYKIFRDVTNVSGQFAGADPEGSDVDVINFDSHKTIDQLGSADEYSHY